jgi:hypothetical protein
MAGLQRVRAALQRAGTGNQDEGPVIGDGKRTDLNGAVKHGGVSHKANLPEKPTGKDRRDYTSRLCSMAARMKSMNSGCGVSGFDFNSGWNCTPTNQG